MEKPRKPYPEFPLYAHATRRWAKKIRGQTYYFGPWDDPDGALAKYLAEVDDLQAGHQPDRGDGLTVRELINAFLDAKQSVATAGDITDRTLRTYHATCKLIAKHLGRERLVARLKPSDFDGLRLFFAKGRGPHSLGNHVRHTRMLFGYAYGAALIEAPVRFGPLFKEPSKRVMRKARNERGKRSFTADELRTIIEAAPMPLRTMVLLGINCGFGNSDVSTLDRSAIEDGWIDFPRPKTGIPRRAPLWAVTSTALEAAAATRPEPRSPADADAVFLTKRRNRWVHTGPSGSQVDGVAQQFAKLLASLDLKVPGLNFYSLRRTFETVAGASKDQVAVDLIMGHADDSMAAVYREEVQDDRLQDVVEHVRGWLFG